MKFSIIIPVYQVEQHLRKAVESILTQSVSDYEIILVDDGSPDRCPEICDSLAQINSRIKVIHKSNGGLSDARNAGMTIASGDYIIFLDSDDQWIDSEGLKYISEYINRDKPDVIIFGVEDYYPISGKRIISRGNYNEEKLNSLSTKELIGALVSEHNFPGAAWMLATRRDFINSNNINFVKGVTAEDFDWLVKIFSHASSVKMLNRTIYQYRYTSEGSITSKPRVSGIMGIHNAITNWINYEYADDYQSITNYLSHIYLQALLNYAGLPKDEQFQVRQLLIDDSLILKKSKIFHFHIFDILIKTCGIGIISRFIKAIRNTLKR